MITKPMVRFETPLTSDGWNTLGAVITRAAKCNLVGRRLLHVEGPLNPGSHPLSPAPQGAGPGRQELPPLMEVEETFLLGREALARYQQGGDALVTRTVTEAALTTARIEDQLIFYGANQLPGLLTFPGTSQLVLSSWESAGMAVKDIGQAIRMLEDDNFCGPYALALTPSRYNMLFRLSPRLNQSEMEHLRNMGVEGVFRAPVLQSGGLLLSYGRQYASILLGRDISLHFAGLAGDALRFSISHSFSLRVPKPAAHCVLSGLPEEQPRLERVEVPGMA